LVVARFRCHWSCSGCRFTRKGFNALLTVNQQYRQEHATLDLVPELHTRRGLGASRFTTGYCKVFYYSAMQSAALATTVPYGNGGGTDADRF
jgi:hypothetical protein